MTANDAPHWTIDVCDVCANVLDGSCTCCCEASRFHEVVVVPASALVDLRAAGDEYCRFAETRLTELSAERDEARAERDVARRQLASEMAVGRETGRIHARVRAERDRYKAALEYIRDHGKTHDQPCFALLDAAIRERDEARAERDRYKEALERADWLITCLRSVTRRVPVRNLDEAEEGWRIARAALAVPAPKEDDRG